MFPEARISAVLSSLAGHAGDRLTVADIVAVLRDRAFAILIVLLGLPNCLPMPPPIPLVCGLLLLLVAVQIAAGQESPWLPQRLLRQSVPQEAVTRAVLRAMPVLKRLELLSRPRFAFLETPLALRLIGFLLLSLALGLLVAAPVIGQIPIGVAVCLVGLGLVERDGVVVLVGIVLGAVGLAANFGFAYAIFSLVEHLVWGDGASLPNVHPDAMPR
ncbi:exopolysaccharide biosynthesis protein [Enterovirga sp.]|uniref:exopolysaccharide biosynthesis protein n=1 Tax=Enterovirga sp. TaxID=2026350 RepID=UPI0026164E8E|nr:exopolysaccharide biosynthesis protein [Enterovirga sp.]MDB5591370.1 exopolysaccharide biosynthesis protein exod [Enterovirga sp.]